MKYYIPDLNTNTQNSYKCFVYDSLFVILFAGSTAMSEKEKDVKNIFALIALVFYVLKSLHQYYQSIIIIKNVEKAFGFSKRIANFVGNNDTLTLKVSTNNKYLRSLYEEKEGNLNGDTGKDLYMPKTVTIKPGGEEIIDLEIKCEPASNFHYILCQKSSSGKSGLRLKNGICIIDKKYGETIKVCACNDGDDDLVLEKGNRYFQLYFLMLMECKLDVVNENK